MDRPTGAGCESPAGSSQRYKRLVEGGPGSRDTAGNESLIELTGLWTRGQRQCSWWYRRQKGSLHQPSLKQARASGFRLMHD
jgi:hypothetical protein